MIKKILFVLVGIAVVAAIIGFARHSGRQEAGTSPAPDTYTVVVLASEVMVKNPSETDFATVSASAEVVAGSQIKTSATGKAKLLYPNGTVTLIEENSVIEVKALDGKGAQSSIRIVSGGIWAKVKNILGTGDYYDVETDNVVASVRGTMFRIQSRNHITSIYGIEHRIHLRARHADGADISGTDIDLNAGEKASVGGTALAAEGKALAKQVMTTLDFQQAAIRDHVMDMIEKADLGDADMRAFVEKVRATNIQDLPFIKRMIERELIIGATVSPSPKPSASPSLTILPTATPSPSPTPVPSPTPTPDTRPTLESAYPKTISAGSQFTINGTYFTIGRGTPQITAVAVGKIAAKFTILDSLTIFATPDASLAAGTYDVSVTTSTGTVLTLPQAITIQ